MMGRPLASAPTGRLHYEVVQGAAPMGARSSLALDELVRRAKRATLFARQLKRIQEIGADESLGLFEGYQQMHEVALEITNPRAESMVCIEEGCEPLLRPVRDVPHEDEGIGARKVRGWLSGERPVL